MSKVDYFLTTKALTKDAECGDTGVIKEFKDGIFISLVDVAGHSENSFKVAVKSKKFLEENYKNDLIEIMEDFHEYLKGSVGAVAFIGLLNKENGELKYVTAGNISIVKFGKDRTDKTRFLSKGGIIGYIIPSIKIEEIILNNDDVLILYTDGIKENLILEDCPGILKKNARTIAKTVINRFGKDMDDASCMVLIYKK